MVTYVFFLWRGRVVWLFSDEALAETEEGVSLFVLDR